MGIAHGLKNGLGPDPERVEIFDPFRVTTINKPDPWALPTAINFHAFGVKRSKPA